MEPPGADLPASPPLIAAALDPTTVRVAVAAAAAAVALSSHGNVLLLAALLAVLAAEPLAGLAVVAAAAATVVRWGSPSLAALAGDQSVLGAAVKVGPTLSATSSALAATAILLVARRVGAGRAGLAGAVPFGCAAAAVAAGPGPGGDLLVRAVATAGGVVLAALVVAATRRDAVRLVAGALALAAGVAAIACAVAA